MAPDDYPDDGNRDSMRYNDSGFQRRTIDRVIPYGMLAVPVVAVIRSRAGPKRTVTAIPQHDNEAAPATFHPPELTVPLILANAPEHVEIVRHLHKAAIKSTVTTSELHCEIARQYRSCSRGNGQKVRTFGRGISQPSSNRAARDCLDK